MHFLKRILLGLFFLMGFMVWVAWEPFACGQEPAKLSKEGKASAHAWTLEEALSQLRLYPKDVYLQYVVLQLARREKRQQEIVPMLDRTLGNEFRMQMQERQQQVDLFNIFLGALAVQESLQLDTMRGQVRRPQPNVPIPPPAHGTAKDAPQAKDKRSTQPVQVASLTGPTVKSHPWSTMLAGKKPATSPLALCVPEDFYFVEFRSVNKMLDLLDSNESWGMHLFSQVTQEARTQQISERLKTQLAIETNKLLRPFYDLVVEDLAITGSDLFVREGSDVTLIFRAKQPAALKARMDGFLANAQKTHTNAKRSQGSHQGVPYVHLATPDRAVHVYSAYPKPDLHVRSNSLVGLQRVLEAIQGKRDGQKVRRLGDTEEFAYIRTLMPWHAVEEDGFVYLSDPFIRHMVGPQLKLTERRRMLCYNHLRMIGHAALLFRTEHGRAPSSLAELAENGCAPGVFGQGELTCPSGGQYRLSADGMTGVCSHHGHATSLTPCCEIPTKEVKPDEADEYKAFLEDYNRYWQTYFDPIALRVQVTPERYRFETIVLPLINNSIYAGLAKALGGKAEMLDPLPVPRRNIFSLAVRVNKEELLSQAGFDPKAAAEKPQAEPEKPGQVELNFDKELERFSPALEKFLSRGIGNQVALHAYDATPFVDFSLTNVGALILQEFNRSSSRDLELAGAGTAYFFVASALNGPVYISAPVQDKQIVDEFLSQLDTFLVRVGHLGTGFGPLRIETDFYHLLQDKEKKIRVYGFRFGPIKWRMFWGRIGGGLYIASKPTILEDLLAMEAAGVRNGPTSPPAHGMLRLRPQNWNQVLADYRLGWSENDRIACMHNHGPLADLVRAFQNSGANQADLLRDANRWAQRLFDVEFYCPDGGTLMLGPDGKTVSCSVHGSALAPRQQATPSEKSATSQFLRTFAGMTITLSFLEDGLHAVLETERK